MIKPVLMCIEFFTILGIISNYLECYVAARIQAVNEALRCNLFMLSITGSLSALFTCHSTYHCKYSCFNSIK